MRRRTFLLAAATMTLGACAQGEPGVAIADLRGREVDFGESDRTTPSPTAAPDDGKSEESAEDDAAEAVRPDVDPANYPDTASEWGENVTGVKTRLATDERVVALTFDANGGPNGTDYDEELIDFLVAEEIPATLFISQRWIEVNEDVFGQLADQPLFEIGNHGTHHLPLSVNGRGVYGYPGTQSPAHVIDEVMDNQATLERLTGQRPAYFRSGTAYYDEVAVQIVNDLGLEVVGFDIRGDAGATYTADQVASALAAAEPGSIAILQMNQPTSGTAAGVRTAVPLLRDQGFSFTKVGDYDLE
jgi:peptidoglycan/xylan/chitin deacetylase (PgdA/CDA1 family)